LNNLHEFSATDALSWYGRSLTPGEVGCYLSHINTLDAFLETDHDYALVLEDDAILNPDCIEEFSKLLQLIEEQKTPFDGMINLGAASKKLYTKCACIGAKAQNFICKSHYVPFTAHALLWSRAAAKKLVDNYRPINAPYDVFLRDWNSIFDCTFTLQKPLFSVVEDGSLIDATDCASLSPRRSTSLMYWSRQRRRFAIKPRIYWNLVRFRVHKAFARNKGHF